VERRTSEAQSRRRTPWFQHSCFRPWLQAESHDCPSLAPRPTACLLGLSLVTCLPGILVSFYILGFQKNFCWGWNAHMNIPIHISLERSNLIELHSDFTGMRWEGFKCYKVRNFSDIIFCWKNILSGNGREFSFFIYWTHFTLKVSSFAKKSFAKHDTLGLYPLKNISRFFKKKMRHDTCSQHGFLHQRMNTNGTGTKWFIFLKQ
jgi:hypothetical protein